MTDYGFTKQDLLNDYWGYVGQTVRDYTNKDFVVTDHGSLTFSQANQHANTIFAAIRKTAAWIGGGIGLFLPDPLKVIPAMIGVLKSRNYFIPLDVTFPEATLLAMFETAGIRLILTNGQHLPRIHSLAGKKLPIINIDGLDYAAPIPDPIVSYAPEDIVQILFTSGSTGQPKGAVEDYRYLVRAAYVKNVSRFSDPDDRHIQLSTYTFSGPHTGVFSSLVNGSSIYIYDLKGLGMAGLPDWIRRHEITTYQSTPTVFRSLVGILQPGDQFPSIRKFSFGAETRMRNDIQALKRHFPMVESFRLGFASTETQAVTSSYYVVDHDFGQGGLPSGKPYEDIEVYIWDEDGCSLPAGREGEIVVHGDALARGYINNPELTEERFLADPERPGWQYFKTGDLGKLLPDGQLVHLGRIDNMVKLKGVRIELDAIENHLLSFPGIIQAASRAVTDPNGNHKLASYFVPEPGIHVPTSDLRKHLAERLPRHLLPHYLIPLDEMPLTGNGKVARNRLPMPQFVRPDFVNPFEAPADDLEAELVRIWEEEIGITGIGVGDDFFDLGGDSLIGVMLFVQIEECLGRNLPVSVLLTANTVRKQAELIREQDPASDFTPVISIRDTGTRPPLFFIPGRGGYPTRIRHLARLLDPGIPVYALQDLATPQQGRGLRSMESIASFYLNEVRKIRPKGPYILVGESMGGKIAFEMAQQLRQQGDADSLLVMLDTYNQDISPYSRYKSNQNISYYWMLLKKHATILAKSNWQGRREYLRFYAETGKQKVRSFVLHRIERLKRTRPVLPNQLSMIESHSRELTQAYQPQAYPGRVIFFKATRGQMVNHQANGWEKVDIGELIIHPLDCYHGSILFEPAVSQLARILQTIINAEFSSRNPHALPK